MEKVKKQKNPNKLTQKELWTWSLKGFSTSMNVMILGFLTIYCTNILGMNIALVGTLMLASRVLDIFTDMIIGYVVDKTNTKLGRGRPYELCIIGTWASTVLLFSCPPSFSMVAKCIWVLSVYILVNSGFNSIMAAAQTPYIVRAFNNQEKYVALTSYGGLITMLGAVVVNIGFPILMGTMATSAKGWTTLITIFAVPATLIGLLRFFFIPEKYNVDATTEHLDLKGMFKVLKSNKYIYQIAFITLISSIVANMGVSVFYFTYVVKNVEAMGLTAAVQLLMVPIMFIFPPLLKKFAIRDVILAGIIIQCIGCVIYWFAGANLMIIILASIFVGIGAVPLSMLAGLMIIDCAEYNEWKGMHRLEATLSVIPNLTSNLGSAFGAFLLGVFLNGAGYISTVEGVTVDQPASAILMLRLLVSFIPLALYILSAITAKFYNLDKLMPQIRKENGEKHASILDIAE